MNERFKKDTCDLIDLISEIEDLSEAIDGAGEKTWPEEYLRSLDNQLEAMNLHSRALAEILLFRLKFYLDNKHYNQPTSK